MGNLISTHGKKQEGGKKKRWPDGNFYPGFTEEYISFKGRIIVTKSIANKE